MCSGIEVDFTAAVQLRSATAEATANLVRNRFCSGVATPT
jgi:hypothetical protein